ncbi:MAG: hypothetical protein HKO65_18230 [Gemmatimonadetes bacterium]|nr:hypothetical protein [Gemmatimonadota bacterium]NNM07037.1 hypothetical protein [Gemmatimonadota bacterium]
MVRSGVIAVGVLGLFLSLAACARGRPVTGRGGVRAITQEEIQASDARDALELIQMIRPVWLAGSLLGDPTDPTVQGGPTVLINDIPPKPLFSLQFLPLEDIREIQYLTRTYAETRFRVGARNGLILVLTLSPVNPGDSIRPDTGAVFRTLAPPEPRRTFSPNG